MANEADRELQAQLELFRQRFLTRLQDMLATFEQQLGAPELPQAALREIHFQLHKLAGSGGTLGFDALSRQARALELQAQAWLADGAGAAWKAAVLALRQTVPAASAGACGRGGR